MSMRRRTSKRYNLSDSEMTLTATALRRASRETKLDAMRTWFYGNYEDPAECTPYESAEGGYIYIWGGPYEPEEELQDEFGGLISDDVIAELADELQAISWEWTHHPEHDETEDYLFASIAQSTEHQKAFSDAIENIENLLSLRIKGARKTHLFRLLYVNVITAVETYLSDVFISLVGNDKALLRRFIESTPEFKAEKVSVADIYKAMDEIEKRAQSYLLDVVWHHLKRVKPMFKATLNIEFPEEIAPLFTAVVVRHDLVHRNGKTKAGGQHDITSKEVRELIKHTCEFVSHVDKQLTASPTESSVDIEVPSDASDF